MMKFIWMHLKVANACVLSVVLMTFSQSSVWGAEIKDSEIPIENVLIIKPSITASIAGEVLTGWQNSGFIRVANGGSWHTVLINISAPTTSLTYSEDGNTYSVYNIGSSGVGFVMSVTQRNCAGGCGVAGPIPMQGSGYVNITGPEIIGFGSSDISYNVKLIATGSSINTGSINIGALNVGSIYLEGSLGHNSASVGLKEFSLTHQQQGCIASASPSSIDMGVVSADRFHSVGSTVDGLLPVTVHLECDPGLAVYATMTDQNNPANVTDTLSLGPSDATSATGVATGVGVRFLNGSVPIVYGPASAYVTGMGNQWQVKDKNQETTTSFVLRPQYIKTANEMSPGVANARASITFAYD